MYLFTLATELSTDVFAGAYFLYHINQALGCFLLCLYYFLLFRRRMMQNIVRICFILYLAFVSYYFLHHPKYFLAFDPIDFVVEGVFISFFSVYYLIELYQGDDSVLFSRNAHFWMAVGNLLFYSGASIFMGFAFTLGRSDSHLYRQLSYIVYFLNLLLYSIYIKAFLCRWPMRRSE